MPIYVINEKNHIILSIEEYEQMKNHTVTIESEYRKLHDDLSNKKNFKSYFSLFGTEVYGVDQHTEKLSKEIKHLKNEIISLKKRNLIQRILNK